MYATATASSQKSEEKIWPPANKVESLHCRFIFFTARKETEGKIKKWSGLAAAS